jgi:hypothetical protein
MTLGAAARPAAAACAAHAALTILLFAPVLLFGQVPYLRDVSTYYYPDYVFAAQALRGGTWPLWNPTADAGAPFLMAYPGDLLMLLVLGARRTLVLSPPLHVWLAMCGTTLLAKELGCRWRGAWVAGAALGLSGLLLSSLNLFELAHGAALAPLVVTAYLRCFRRPTGPAVALLGLLAAVLASTLAAEVALQAALVALVLTPALPTRRQWRALATAGLVAAALGAPVLLGARALIEGGARASGFTAAEALKWSVHPVVLGEMLWPRLLGDPHTMTNLGYWGQPYFPDGYPYFVSLYLGPIAIALAACAGRRHARLWLLAAIGVLLALGAHGPLSAVLPVVLPHFRSPVKFLYLTTLSLALLAGLGLARATEDRRRFATLCLAVPAGVLLSAGLAIRLAPQTSLRWAVALWPRLGRPEALPLADAWPPALLQTGALAALAAGSLWLGRRAALAPGACLVADLLATNAGVNPSAPARFYDLAPEVAGLVDRAPAARESRWFTYGIVITPGVAWSPALLRRNQDVWLYYLDRQTLWARTKALDGLDGALDEDRTGWAPPGSTLSGAEATPALHRRHHALLRLAGVRFVLSFVPLPQDLATPLGEARLPWIVQPLGLYEMRDALPRAFWVPDCEVAGSAAAARARVDDPAFDPRSRVVLESAPRGAECGRAGPGGGASTVRWRRLGPHEVEIEADGEAGYVVLLEGYHRDWRAEGPGGVISLLRADTRYCALPVPGGRVRYRVRFRPRWVWPAAGVAGLGALSALVLALRRAEKLDTSSSVALASDD